MSSRRTPAGAAGPNRRMAGSLWLAVLLLAPAQAFSAHPLITDDTGTQGRGKYQLELNGGVLRNRETRSGTLSSQDGAEVVAAFSAGVLDNVDLVVSVPWGWSAAREAGVLVSDEKAFGNATVEAKCRLFEHEDLSVAVKPGLSYGSGDFSLGAVLIATQRVGRLSFHANAGYTRNEFKLKADRDANRRDIWRASIAAVAQVLRRLQAVGNVGVETNGDRSSSTWPAFALGGVIYSVTSNLDLDLGVKAGLNEAQADLTALAGVTWRF